MSEVALTDVAYAETTIPSAPALDDERTDVQQGKVADRAERFEFQGVELWLSRPPIRTATVTDMAYVDGELIVAGMSNEEFSSTLRRIPFPFAGEVADTQLEIFHVSHGKWETAAPIRTFVPYEGGASILASYTCTPLVHFSLGDITPGTRAKGRTVAELGWGNQPLDMVSFTQGGEEYLLVAHSRHPLMKISCRDIDAQDALTEPKEPVGVPFEALDVPGVVRLATLDADHVLTLQRRRGRRPPPALPEDRVAVARASRAASTDVVARLGARRAAASTGSRRARARRDFATLPRDALARELPVFASRAARRPRRRTHRAGARQPSRADARRVPLRRHRASPSPHGFPLLRGRSYSVVVGGQRLTVELPGPDGRTEPTVVAVHPTRPGRPPQPAPLLRRVLRSDERGRGGALRGGGRRIGWTRSTARCSTWIPSCGTRGRRRLTVLFDPARLKRGLAPHREAGYPLRRGEPVSLVVDATMRDARGSPARHRRRATSSQSAPTSGLGSIPSPGTWSRSRRVRAARSVCRSGARSTTRCSRSASWSSTTAVRIVRGRRRVRRTPTRRGCSCPTPRGRESGTASSSTRCSRTCAGTQ